MSFETCPRATLTPTPKGMHHDIAEWQTSSRYMMVEAFAQIDKEEIDPILSITMKAA